MERRAAERVKVQFEAKVTVLNDHKQSAVARVSDISNAGVSVELPFPLKSGVMVKLEMADSTLYGQVIYSKEDASTFRTGISATRVALGSTTLSEMLQRALMDAQFEVPGLEPTEVHIG